MDAKPPELIYGLDDKPPWTTTFFLASQHMMLAITYSAFAVFVLREVGAGPAMIQTVTVMSLIVCALGIALQALKRSPVGSGYLVVHINSVIYIPASLAAGALGGPALIWGMTLVAGLCEVLLSRVMGRLRSVFPPEVCGVVVAMVGFSLIKVALLEFLGRGMGDTVTEGRELAASAVTLVCLVGLSIWGRGPLKLFCLLLSLLAGYLVSLATGLIGPQELKEIMDQPWFQLPSLPHHGWDFSANCLLPFMVAAVAAVAKSTGLIITLQGINHPEQKRPDMTNVGRGILADGLGTMAAGLLGTIGTNLAPTSVGLNSATGASSRRIAYVAAGLVLTAAFLPKVVSFITLIPVPVMGSVLIYAVCIISFSGLQLILTAQPGPRLTYLVGLSLLAGFGSELLPHIVDQLPPWAALTLHSPITVTALVAIGLNLLFRLGKDKG